MDACISAVSRQLLELFQYGSCDSAVICAKHARVSRVPVLEKRRLRVEVPKDPSFEQSCLPKNNGVKGVFSEARIV